MSRMFPGATVTEPTPVLEPEFDPAGIVHVSVEATVAPGGPTRTVKT